MSGYTLLYLPEVDSTNEYALRNLRFLADRQVIAAGIQTKGRGRLNRNWISDVPKNVYASIILKPRDSWIFGITPANISQYMALCICELLESYQVCASLKWPNDILVERKKIAGILGQAFFNGSRMESFILGTGINLNLSEKDLMNINQPASALNLLTGRPINRNQFLGRLLNRFFNGYDEFVGQGFPSIIEAYEQRSLFLGELIKVLLPDGEVEGRAAGFEKNGCLIIERPGGGKAIIAAGDVVSSGKAGP